MGAMPAGSQPPNPKHRGLVMNILHVDSSILGGASASRELSAAVLARQLELHPDATVIELDLGSRPIGHLTGAHLAAAQGAVPEAGELLEDIAAGQTALADFLGADIVIIGAPMYNFGIPSQLKAWIDRLAVAGQTFRYTENGPEGLAGGKKVIIAASRGGFYGPGTPAAGFEHQESYLRAIFTFFGITDLTVIHAEGIALGAVEREAALGNARAQITALAA
jgi:FMN-dependent NADH-azoreductase